MRFVYKIRGIIISKTHAAIHFQGSNGSRVILSKGAKIDGAREWLCWRSGCIKGRHIYYPYFYLQPQEALFFSLASIETFNPVGLGRTQRIGCLR